VKTNPADVALAQKGDRAAAGRVLASMEGLCRWVALKRTRSLPPTMSLDDAIQECRYGVLRAIPKFNARKGVPFEPYATLWMTATLGRSIDVERAGAAPSKSPGTGRHVTCLAMPLDTRVYDDGADPLTFLDLVPDERDTADVQLEREADIARVRQAVAQLPPKLRHVVEKRMEGLTLREIGAPEGRTSQAISLRQTRAHELLREELEAA
jgi:RNA polymerase sigma factor (sigma-70 family)